MKIQLDKSLINIANRSGAIKLPLGIPETIGNILESSFLLCMLKSVKISFKPTPEITSTIYNYQSLL